MLFTKKNIIIITIIIIIIIVLSVTLPLVLKNKSSSSSTSNQVARSISNITNPLITNPLITNPLITNPLITKPDPISNFKIDVIDVIVLNKDYPDVKLLKIAITWSAPKDNGGNPITQYNFTFIKNNIVIPVPAVNTTELIIYVPYIPKVDIPSMTLSITSFNGTLNSDPILIDVSKSLSQLTY